MRKISAIFLLSLISGICAAQTVVSGFQRRIPSENAELRCESLRIDRAMRIDSVSGYNNGFWIERNSKVEKAFWTQRYVQDAIGYVLTPGIYNVYPNLRQGVDTASVTIWLKKR